MSDVTIVLTRAQLMTLREMLVYADIQGVRQSLPLTWPVVSVIELVNDALEGVEQISISTKGTE